MFTIESFCNAVWGTSYMKVSQKISKDAYKEFQIPKKGGTRTINYLEKESELWNLQSQLLSKFLSQQDLPICVKGFRKGENYQSFLAEHIGSRFFLRTDISSFFPSITESNIKHELSNLLVCNPTSDKEKLLDLICEITTLNGSLPQGARTSPAVSNLVLARIDQRITKYCQVFNVRYTRYADDMLFSSTSFNFQDKKWFLKKLKHILSSQSLKLNYSKIKYGESSLVLNGFIISNDGISLSRNRLSDIRHIVAFAKNNYDFLTKSGAQQFITKVNQLLLKHRNLKENPFKTIFQFIQYMCGYRAFLISMVDDTFTSTSFQKELQHLIHKLEVQISRYAALPSNISNLNNQISTM